MKQILKKLLSLIIIISKAALFKLNQPKQLKWDDNLKMELLNINNKIDTHNKYIFQFLNTEGYVHQDFFVAIWNSLNLTTEWHSIPNKIMMISLRKEDEVLYIVKNTPITDKTNPSEFIDLIRSQLQNFWDEGSIEDTLDFTLVEVEVWIGKITYLKRHKVNKLNKFFNKRSYSTSTQFNSNIKKDLLEILNLL
uniref:hypothetical protein n=1 Tax=Peniophora lycii TaxID=154539 RepID=UPI001BEED836|nr:hypothetical protein MFQ47_mgp04 [Peniophora lycii]QUA00856.1 hypothetical protein [Peniophora lycii]